MVFQNKNSRVGRNGEEEDFNVLPKYNGGNVGATWKTGKRKGGSQKLSFEIKRKQRFGRGY